MKTTQTTFMKVVDHGQNKINLVHLGAGAAMATPTEFHFKSNGAKDDGPSIVIVMQLPFSQHLTVYGQMSVNTLNECLNTVGHRVEKIINEPGR